MQTLYYETDRFHGANGEVEIPENVTDIKVLKGKGGIFLQYVTEDDKKIEWAKKVVREYHNKGYTVYADALKGVCCVQFLDGRFGFSRCSKKDKFNETVGEAVALYSIFKLKIPDFV